MTHFRSPSQPGRRLLRDLFAAGLLFLTSFQFACRAERTADDVPANSADASCCVDIAYASSGGADPDKDYAHETPKGEISAEAINTDFSTEFWPPAERKGLNFDFVVTRNDGAEFQMSELVGRPMAIAFFYTRCTNPRKCHRVASSIRELSRLLQRRQQSEDVRLLLVTYDPAWDTAPILDAYASGLGMQSYSNVMLLAPRVEDTVQLFRDFQVPVTFYDGGVTVHGIQLLLVDRQGRLARVYRVIMWDNLDVADHLQQLVNEEAD